MSETKELRAQAEELGIKVDGRWSDERIQSEIDKALSDDEPNEGGTKYSPNTEGRVEILGVHICEGFLPSDTLVKNEDFMSRLKHGVKCGLINELAE